MLCIDVARSHPFIALGFRSGIVRFFTERLKKAPDLRRRLSTQDQTAVIHVQFTPDASTIYFQSASGTIASMNAVGGSPLRILTTEAIPSVNARFFLGASHTLSAITVKRRQGLVALWAEPMYFASVWHSSNSLIPIHSCEINSADAFSCCQVLRPFRLLLTNDTSISVFVGKSDS